MAGINQSAKKFFSRATAIHTRNFRIPSDLRRQAGNGSVSTMVGDHMGILSAVVLFLDSSDCFIEFERVFYQYFYQLIVLGITLLQ